MVYLGHQSHEKGHAVKLAKTTGTTAKRELAFAIATVVDVESRGEIVGKGQAQQVSQTLMPAARQISTDSGKRYEQNERKDPRNTA